MRVITFPRGNEQCLFDLAVLTGIVLLGCGGRHVPKDSENTLGKASDRIDRVRDQMLPEADRCRCRMLDRVYKRFALLDLAKGRNGLYLLEKLPQGTIPGNFENAKIGFHCEMMHVPVGYHWVPDAIMRP